VTLPSATCMSLPNSKTAHRETHFGNRRPTSWKGKIGLSLSSARLSHSQSIRHNPETLGASFCYRVRPLSTAFTTFPSSDANMPKKTETKEGSAESDRLMVLMAERILQALTRNPQLFRSGRGQLIDFSERYGIKPTSARRILSGGAFPPPTTLQALSADTKVSIDWFFGGGHFDSIDDEADSATVPIPIFGQTAMIGLPRVALSQLTKASEFIAITVDNNDFEPHVKSGDYGIIAISNIPSLRNPPCAVVFGNNPLVPRLALIEMSDPRGGSYVISDASGKVATYSSSLVQFGDKEPSKDGIQVIGPLVGRVCLDGFRPIPLPHLPGRK
jgi:transcriptional regulator with XRE-family HTH domain